MVVHLYGDSSDLLRWRRLVRILFGSLPMSRPSSFSVSLLLSEHCSVTPVQLLSQFFCEGPVIRSLKQDNLDDDPKE